jgi:hypothetical protein
MDNKNGAISMLPENTFWEQIGQLVVEVIEFNQHMVDSIIVGCFLLFFIIVRSISVHKECIPRTARMMLFGYFP